MKVVNYPGCCTAKILMGFGQESNAGYEARPPRKQTTEELKVEVDKALRGYMIGRHNGIVSACLTSRQVNGIAALTELGFHSSGAKVKTGHRESQLLTFYINPAEYLDTNPRAYVSPVVPGVPRIVGRLVKDLNPTARRVYNSLMRDSRLFDVGSHHYNLYRAQAKRLLEVDASFA